MLRLKTLGENSSGETPTSLRRELYYVSMTGNSLEQAIKSVIAKYPACGLSAKIGANSDKLSIGKYDLLPNKNIGFQPGFPGIPRTLRAGRQPASGHIKGRQKRSSHRFGFQPESRAIPLGQTLLLP